MHAFFVARLELNLPTFPAVWLSLFTGGTTGLS